MLPRILLLLSITWLGIIACAASQSVDPAAAQQTLAAAWSANRHIVWEIKWPAAPITGGTLTVETWRNGPRYRYEILEAPTPALMGETLVFDGHRAWQYNRFDPPPDFAPTKAVLSPVSDAFALIDLLLATPPETASQQRVQVNFVSAQRIVLTYTNGDTLTLWQNLETGLPERVEISTGHHQLALNARSAEPLLDPLDELFMVGEWLRN